MNHGSPYSTGNRNIKLLHLNIYFPCQTRDQKKKITNSFVLEGPTLSLSLFNGGHEDFQYIWLKLFEETDQRFKNQEHIDCIDNNELNIQCICVVIVKYIEAMKKINLNRVPRKWQDMGKKSSSEDVVHETDQENSY